MTVKSQILEILEKNRDTDVSGEYMAGVIGVSRNSVWKAINALRLDGYDILSSTNKGYRLAADCDIISAEGIRIGMSYQIPVFTYKTTDSTNVRAKHYLAENDCDRAVFAAEEQTAGRGRMGRSFYSPYGSGVYMSYVFSPKTEVANTVSVTAAASVAVVRALEKTCGVHPMIKWVNDIYIDEKKLCGILTEAVSNCETSIVEHVVIGIGINFSVLSFPEELADKACSLSVSGVTRNMLIASVCDELYGISKDLSDKSFFETYRERMLVIGRDITYYENSQPHSAHVLDVDQNGGLIVCGSDGNEKILRSGEITVRFN